MVYLAALIEHIAPLIGGVAALIYDVASPEAG
jgi:hypothetical protein